MSLFTKKEFGGLCGITTNVLAVYIKRGKVIASGELIDDSIPQNVAYLQNRQMRNAIRPVKPPKVVKAPEYRDPVLPDPKPKPTPNPVPVPKPEPKPKPRPEIPDSVRKDAEDVFRLEKAQKTLQIDKTKTEIDILIDKREKQRGTLIPFDAVKIALGQHFRDMTLYIGQGIENLLAEVAHKAKLNLNDRTELHHSMERILNDSVDRAIDATNTNLRTMQKEYSLKKGVGEKA